MKKLFSEDYAKKLFDRWGIVSKLEDDGSKYGSIDMNAWVNNELLGICQVKKITELERNGAITYHYGRWKIKGEIFEIDGSNIDRFPKGKYHVGQKISLPTKAWNDYMDRNKNRLEHDKESFEQLVATN